MWLTTTGYTVTWIDEPFPNYTLGRSQDLAKTKFVYRQIRKFLFPAIEIQTPYIMYSANTQPPYWYTTSWSPVMLALHLLQLFWSCSLHLDHVLWRQTMPGRPACLRGDRSCKTGRSARFLDMGGKKNVRKQKCLSFGHITKTNTFLLMWFFIFFATAPETWFYSKTSLHYI